MTLFFRRLKPVAAGVLACALFLGQPGLAQEKPKKVGAVLDVTATEAKAVTKLETDARSGGSRWYQAYPKMATFLSEHLKTGPKTTATLEFAIGGQAVISPGTEIEIVNQKQVEEVGNKIVVKSGAMWAKVDKQKEQLQIQTAGGTMGIEGTEFFVEVQPDGSTKLVVVEGAVRVNGAEGEVVTGGQLANFGATPITSRTYYTGASVFEARELALKEVDPALAPVFRSLMNRFLYRLPLRQIGYAERVIGFIQDPEAQLNAEVDREARRLWAQGPGRPIGVGPFRKSAPFPEPKPVKDLRVEGDQPQFTWDNAPGAESYNLVISKDAEGKQVVWFTQTDQKESFTYPSYGPALEAGSYHWFLTPLNDDGTPKTWSITGIKPKSLAANRSFHTSGFEPTYGTVAGVETDGQSFKWEEYEEAGSYQVQVAYDEAMDEILVNDEVTDTEYEYPTGARPLEPGTYYARVVALDRYGFTMARSAPVSFTRE